jgi:hypothetical protein
MRWLIQVLMSAMVTFVYFGPSAASGGDFGRHHGPAIDPDYCFWFAGLNEVRQASHSIETAGLTFSVGHS